MQAKISFTFHVFLEILKRYSKLVILGTLGMSEYAHWTDTTNLWKLSCLSAGKKSFSSPTFSLETYKDMQTSRFGYLRHAWLHTPKMIISPYRKLRCLSACQKYTPSLTSFLRYYILKNLAIWLANSILAHNLRIRYLSDMGLVVKYQWQYSFSF